MNNCKQCKGKGVVPYKSPKLTVSRIIGYYSDWVLCPVCKNRKEGVK